MKTVLSAVWVLGLAAAAHAAATTVTTVQGLAEALQSSSPGDEIVVADGTYLFSAPVTIPAGVGVRSASGDRDACILDGQDATVVFETSSTACASQIAGFTFRNARNTAVGGADTAMTSCGGAIRFTSPCEDADTGCVISNCVFAGCHSDTGFGGALMIAGGTTVADCVFTNCTAMMKGEDGSVSGGGARGGGAIYAVAKTANIRVKGSVFLDCGCSNGVGVVNCGYYIGHSSTTGGQYSKNNYGTSFADCAFSNNWAYGSTCCMNLKCRLVERTVFSGNKTYASVDAGGTARAPQSVVWHAQEYGGDNQIGLSNTTVTNTFVSCVFDGNIVQYAKGRSVDGGLYYHKNNIRASFSNCTFTANQSPGRGVTIYAVDGPVTLIDCLFEGNKSTFLASTDAQKYQGYPIVDLHYAKNGSNTKLEKGNLIRNCRFVGNTTTYNGGTVTINKYTSVIDCEFRANVRSEGTAYRSGILHTESANLDSILIRGCLFAYNTNSVASARSDSVVYIANWNLSNNQAVTSGKNVVVESCTFVGNVTAGTANQNRCGLVHIGSNDTSPGIVRNCLFIDNRSKSGKPLVTFSYGSNNMSTYRPANVTYCAETLSKYPIPTKGDDYDYCNMTNIAFAFRSGRDGFIPKSGPWVNGGLNCAWMAGAVDINGLPRICNGTVDMGCSEQRLMGVAIVVR